MKKNSTLLFFILLTIITYSQNLVLNGDMESWENSSTPTSWELYDNVTQNSTYVHGGTYSAAQMSASSTQKLRQDVINIIGGQEYTTEAKSRIWSYWMEDGTYLDDDEDVLRPSEYSVENPNWQHYTVTLIAPMNANEFRFDVRTYHQDNATGSYIFYDDFSISAETTVYPEPSSYPSNFVAAASGLTISLTWNQAFGTQLPTGYLIYGEVGGSPVFEVPVDGTPVANDLDWSDGKVAVNVGFGTGNYDFGSLDPSQEYSFIIYSFTNSGSNINYKTDGNPPTASATTANVSQVVFEPFDSDLGVFTGYNVSGPQEWEWADFGDPPGCAKGNGYSGGPVANEDWLISPKMEVGNYVQLSLGFQHARNYATNDGLEVSVSTDYSGTGDPNSANWEFITSMFTFPQSGSWTFIDAGTADISSYITNNTYIAFIYNSTNSDASTWEIDNVQVLGVIGTGISNNELNEFEVYPNPADDYILLKSENLRFINIYTLNGSLVHKSLINSNNNRVDISNLPAGLYFVEGVTNTGSRYTKKISIK